jgi:hypothetical protein
MLYNKVERKEKRMYTTIDFKSKKALKEAVAAGKSVYYYQPDHSGEMFLPRGRFFLRVRTTRSPILGMLRPRPRVGES